MSISNIEELDWFVQAEIGNIFMNNAGEIVDKLYVIKNKKDGAGKDKGYYVQNSECHGKDLKLLAKKVFIEKKYKMIYDYFGYSSVTVLPEISFDGVLLSEDTYHVSHTEYMELDEMRLLTSIEDFYPVIIANNEEDVNVADYCNMDVDILSQDFFKPGIMTKIEFDYVDNVTPWAIIEYSQRNLTCKVYGIKKTDNIPLWIEYLITSWSLYEVGNERMAFLTAFASFDSYIEMQYESVRDLYLELSCEVNDARTMEECIKRYNRYSNLQRRIIEDKFKDILNERVKDSKQYSDIYEQLYKYEEMRNSIAHCDNRYQDGEYIELVFVLLRAMYILKFDADISQIFYEE